MSHLRDARDHGLGDQGKIKLTPPEVGRRWGISPEKVVGWIRSGELRAINVATRRGGRPRFLIDIVDLAAFEAARAVSPPPRPASRPRRRKTSSDIIEFF